MYVAPRNNYYRETLDQIYSLKDSIIELAKVLEYDGSRQVARVYTMTSGQYKDDVPVHFPSLYQNSGIISPPVRDSTSLLIWGADRQPYLLPVQITTPAVQVNRGLTNLNASPALIDALLTLKNIQGGETLIRSLGGAYVFTKNIGDVELGTSQLHRLTLSEKDGAFDLSIERIRSDLGNSKFYIGPASWYTNDDLRTHCYFELEEYLDESSKIDGASGEELVNRILSDDIDDIQINENPKMYVSQKGHVFDGEGNLEIEPADDTELFEKTVFQKDNIIHVEKLSKGGRKVFQTRGENSETQLVIDAENIEIHHAHIDNDRYTSTSFRIDSEGRIMCGRDGDEYDLLPVLKWFYTDPSRSGSGV